MQEVNVETNIFWFIVFANTIFYEIEPDVLQYYLCALLCGLTRGGAKGRVENLAEIILEFVKILYVFRIFQSIVV